MNYISGSSIVVLYPITTLRGEGFINPKSPRDKIVRAANKYSARGFASVEFPHAIGLECEVPYGYCTSVLRYTEDSKSLMIRYLDTRAPHHPLAVSASFQYIQFTATPSFWRWSTCPVFNSIRTGLFTGRL